MVAFDDWDPWKAEANLRDHRVSFEEAKGVFFDEDAVTAVDNVSDPTEERFVTVGMSARARILTVIYTIRDERIRLISAWKATKQVREDYTNHET